MRQPIATGAAVEEFNGDEVIVSRSDRRERDAALVFGPAPVALLVVGADIDVEPVELVPRHVLDGVLRRVRRLKLDDAVPLARTRGAVGRDARVRHRIILGDEGVLEDAPVDVVREIFDEDARILEVVLFDVAVSLRGAL